MRPPKLWLVAVILLVGGGRLVTRVDAEDWISPLSRIASSVPRLEMQRGDSTSGVCSAVIFAIDPDGTGHALTAGHCVDHAPTESFDLTIDGRNARPMLVNRIFDLAIVQFRPRGSSLAMAFAPQSPAPGTEITVAGYAFGVEGIVFQFGHIAQTYNKETKAIWVDARIIFGDSGGALVTQDGHLVGISTRVFSQGPANMGGAVPIETVQDFTEDYHTWLARLHPTK